ncbi:MAG TPA: penicillin acylase family protein, partial [Polyangiaceae bacterium]|nr:penicillin acylase family protein [Polyangiaceae bacterium]
AAELLLADLGALAKVFPLGGASNAWAVSGDKSATGRPILASDPHLPPDVPVHWYLSHLVGPGWRATGASFVGIPGIGIGHNEHCAWGVTAAHADNTDFFIEEIGPDGRSVRAEDGSFVRCEVRSERIEVKGRPAVVEDILETPRGPIVGPVFSGANEALSLSATWLAPRPYTGLFLAHKAKSAAEIHELFREASCSSVNLVVADRHGHIGWRLGVEVPVRKSGHGTMPRAGHLPGSGWEPLPIPFEKMPALVDPKEGFVASANNAPTPLSAGAPFFGVDFLDGFRHELLTEALGSRDDFTLADMSALQRDVRSTVWRRVKSIVLAAPPLDEDARRGLAILGSWDGRVAKDSAAASVWILASTTLIGRVLRAKAPNTAGRAMGAGFHPALPVTTMMTRRMSHLVRLLTERPDGFFAEGYDEAIARAVSDAVRFLRDRHGEDEARWGWGEVRPLRLHHALGKAAAPLDYALGLGPFPFEGDASTLSQGTVDFVDPTSGPAGVANLRVVIDVGEFANARFALLAGQSGNPFSPHFSDQYEAFTSGELLSIAWTDADAERTARHRLRLVPG